MNVYNTVPEKFISLYDATADEILTYCWERTADRDMAVHLTKAIFEKAWEEISSSTRMITKSRMETVLDQTAEQFVQSFVPKIDRFHFSDKLWNLTLSQ